MKIKTLLASLILVSSISFKAQAQSSGVPPTPAPVVAAAHAAADAAVEAPKPIKPRKLTFAEKIGRFFDKFMGFNIIDKVKGTVEGSNKQNANVIEEASNGILRDTGPRKPSSIKQAREIQEKLDKIQNDRFKDLEAQLPQD